MKLTNILKKEFLKIFGGSLLALSVIGCSGDKIDSKTYVNNPKYYEEHSVIDTKVNDVNYRMMGVAHTGEFIDYYFDTFENYIKNSSLVIVEAGPEEVNGNFCSKEAHEFFKTVMSLSKKHNKDMITLDSFSIDMYLVEFLQGLGFYFSTAVVLGGIVYGAKKKKKKKIIKAGLMMALGGYLTLSTFVPGLFFRYCLGIDYSKSHYFYDGILDQRNIEITKRALNLDKYIPKEKLKKGEYVLMIFGDAHAKGFDVYVDSPNFRKFKSALYAPTYNLLDNDEIAKFSYENGKWQKEVLKK